MSFSDSLGNLLLTIFLTSSAFAATQYYIDSHTELNMFKAVIWDIENTVRDIDSYLIWLKPIFPYDVIISLLFVFFSGLYVSLKRVSKGYNRYLKFVSTVVLIFTIFTSFTFFGIRLNKHEKGRKENLAFHKVQIIRENQLLAHDIINEKEDQAIQEILSQPQVIELLEEYQQTISNTDSLNLWHLENTEFINEVALLRNQIEQVNTKGRFTDVWSTLVAVKESEVEEIIRNVESKTNSNANEAASFEKFKLRKKDLFNRNISMESTAKARQRFEEYVAQKPAIKSAIFTTYKDPIKKFWKRIYSQTFKELLKPITESIAEIIPFFDEVFDATFHDHVEDSAFELFEQFSTGNTSEVPRSFISKKMIQDITSEVNASQSKLKYWNNKISTILTEGNNLINTAIDKNLKKLRAEDPWQNLRQQMLKE